MVAVGLSDLVYTGLDQYFTILSSIGYKKYGEVYTLLAVSIIDEMLDSDLAYFITEDDYKAIGLALEKLWGTSCLIPYRTFLKGITEPIKELPSFSRLTEDGSLRSVEGDKLRIFS